MSKEIAKPIEEMDGLVCYTDGGSRPNGSYVGWGFHGYTYKDEKPKKGAGIPTHYPSSFGYVAKSEKNQETKTEVKPIQYIDGYGSRQEFGSNNLAELLAANLATTKALELDVKNVLIRTDSEYVRRGYEEWSHAWVRNNWIKADGKPVPNSNQWISLLKNIEDIRSKNISFKIEWVKGHSDKDNTRPDVFGNINADRLATVGVMGSINGENKEHVTISPAEGYWKSDVNKNPMFDHRRLYFNTLDNTSVPGEYYLGNHGKDDDMLGKRLADGCYSVIKLKEKEPIIELVRDYQAYMSGNLDTIVMVRLDGLFKQNVYQYIENYGKNALVRKKKDRIDLYTLDDEPLTREISPPKLAMRAIEALSSLKDILYSYINKDTDDYSIIDITDKFYETKEVPKGKSVVSQLKLKSEFSPLLPAISFDVDVNNKDDNATIKITLTLGLDTPSRNALKSMESTGVKVNLITFAETKNVIRYYTIVENESGIGIWGGVYSNIRFVK